MKEYEKLGLEQMKKAYCTDTMICDYYWGFKEGFAAAREMATSEISRAKMQKLDMGYQAEGALPFLILLGEKEV